MRRPIALQLVAILLAAVTPVVAQTTASRPEDTEEVIRLEVSPAAPPDPALKYTLLVPVAEQVPGPAAPLYLNGMHMLPDKVTFDGKEQEFSALLSDYQEKPLADLKNPSLAALLNQSGALDLLRQGSLRTRADWGTTIREQGFEALLPYLNGIRGVANYLTMHGRSKLAEGDVDGALRDARTLFAVCNHLREEAVLVQALVGTGCGRLGMSRLVEDVVQQPGTPNLYWALANLPRPMFDMRESMEWERAAIRASIGPLRGRSPEQLSPGEWTQVARDFARLMVAVPNPGARAQDQVEVTAFAVVFYPKAKRILIDAGVPAATVDAMPAAQVLGMALLRTYDHWIDEAAKWAGLPYWQAAPHFKASSDAFQAARAKDPFNPAFALLPALDRSYMTLALLDRQVAAVQTVEAIRAYAAGHEGRVPQSLDQITETPAPLDPTTGKVFEYRATGEKSAEISSPPPPGGKKVHGVRYVVTVRK